MNNVSSYPFRFSERPLLNHKSPQLSVYPFLPSSLSILYTPEPCPLPLTSYKIPYLRKNLLSTAPRHAYPRNPPMAKSPLSTWLHTIHRSEDGDPLILPHKHICSPETSVIHLHQQTEEGLGPLPPHPTPSPPFERKGKSGDKEPRSGSRSQSIGWFARFH